MILCRKYVDKMPHSMYNGSHFDDQEPELHSSEMNIMKTMQISFSLLYTFFSWSLSLIVFHWPFLYVVPQVYDDSTLIRQKLMEEYQALELDRKHFSDMQLVPKAKNHHQYFGCSMDELKLPEGFETIHNQKVFHPHAPNHFSCFDVSFCFWTLQHVQNKQTSRLLTITVICWMC